MRAGCPYNARHRSKATESCRTMPYDPDRHHRRSLRLPGYDYTQPGAYFVTICTYQRVCLFDEPRLRAIAERCWRALARHRSRVILDAWVVMPDHVHGIMVIPAAGVDDAATGTFNHRALSPIAAIDALDEAALSVVGGASSSIAAIDAVLDASPPHDGGAPSPIAAIDAVLDASPPHDGGAPSPIAAIDAVLDASPPHDGGAPSPIAAIDAVLDASPPHAGGAQQWPQVNTVDAIVRSVSRTHPFSRTRATAAPLRDAPVRSGGDHRSPGLGINVPPGSLGALVRTYKSTVTRFVNRVRRTPGAPVWQRGYWERIIRDERHLAATRRYIANNPRRWAEQRDNLDALLARMNSRE